MHSSTDLRSTYEMWIRNQPTEVKDRWLTNLLTDPQSLVRDEMQNAFRKENSPALCPTLAANRPSSRASTTGMSMPLCAGQQVNEFIQFIA